MLYIRIRDPASAGYILTGEKIRIFTLKLLVVYIHRIIPKTDLSDSIEEYRYNYIYNN